MLARATQRAKTPFGLCFGYSLRFVARCDHLLSSVGELPLFQQPAADDGMVDTETLPFALDERGLMDLLVPEPLVQVGNRSIERHQADVLNQAGEKELLAVLDADRLGEHVARGRRQ